MTDISALSKFRDGDPPEEEGIKPIEPLAKHLKILAFDQSLANTGWAFMTGSHVKLTGNLKSAVSLKGHEASLDRGVELYYEVGQVVSDTRPELIVIETPPVGNRMIRPESSLMSALVIKIIAHKQIIPVRLIGAQKVKTRLTGQRDAKKKLVREAILKLDPRVEDLKPRNEAIYDAIGVGWIAAETENWSVR